MGHDIYAYEKRNEYAYFRRGAYSEGTSDLYEYLDVTEHDAGVSGDGACVLFESEQLQKALKTAEAEGAAEDIVEFLRKCSEVPEGVIIEFG